MKFFLTQFGLDKKEIDLYLAGLVIGENSVTVLARKAGVNRSTAYAILRGLVKKGFFEEGFKFGKQTFRPTPPAQMTRRFERDQQRKIQSWTEGLPELEALTSRSIYEPKVKFYRGEDGMVKVYDEALRQKFFHGMIDVNEMQSELLERYFWRVGATFMQAGFPCRDIVTDGERGREYKQRYETDLFHIKLAPASVGIASDLFCFQDKFSMISLAQDDFLIVTVESPTLAKTQLMFYEALWNSLD